MKGESNGRPGNSVSTATAWFVGIVNRRDRLFPAYLNRSSRFDTRQICGRASVVSDKAADLISVVHYDGIVEREQLTDHQPQKSIRFATGNVLGHVYELLVHPHGDPDVFSVGRKMDLSVIVKPKELRQALQEKGDVHTIRVVRFESKFESHEIQQLE